MNSSVEDVITESDGGTLLRILVKPGAKREGLEGIDPWRKRVVVAVREKALEGKANKAVVAVLETAFGCRAEITAGHRSREKSVLLHCNIQAVSGKLREIL